jgi:UDP-glucuronate 4-epimerase
MGTKRIFITGSAGFIGFHLAKLLLDNGHDVGGYDALTDYYDVKLKHARLGQLTQYPGFSSTTAMLEDMDRLEATMNAFKPDVIVHLAGQAGVRYSLENPRAYLDSNIVGTFNVMECARKLGVSHLLMASTSSAYGANTKMPFSETDQSVTPLTFYAATKLATESMAHSYAHNYAIPTTMFRFFTVYGPWGRPDMAPHKFTKGIVEGKPIDVYNNGDMWRDFTYVEDLVRAIAALVDVPPVRPASPDDIAPGDSLSPAAPYRLINIGNSDKVRLTDFIEAIEAATGREAIRNYMPMQQGDVPATWADASLLQRLTGYRPQTPVRDGVAKFVAWYQDYYR